MKYTEKITLLICIILLSVSMVLGCTGSQTVQQTTNSNNGEATAKTQAYTPTPIPVGLSKDNPAAVGTSVTFSQKGSVPYTARLTVEEVHRGSEALQMLQKANMFNGELEDQSLEYLLVKAKFELLKFPGYDFNGKHVDTFSVSDTDWHAVSDKKFTGMVLVVCPDPEFGGTLYEGGTTEGWFAVPVYKDDPHPYIEFGDTSALSDEPVIWFQV